MNNSDEFFGDITSADTRAQALKDGKLVDVSQMARKTKFEIPVAVTHAVWHDFIEWTETDSRKQIKQDTDGRLYNVLNMLYFTIVKNPGSNCLLFKLPAVPRNRKSKKTVSIQLKAVLSAGDNGEPVFTIMLPNEN